MSESTLAKKLFFSVLMALLIGTSAAASDLTIARGGRAAARIVVAETAGDVEREAASELGFFLHLVTGADFPVTQPRDWEDNRKPNAPPVIGNGRLLVGEIAALLADPGFKASALAPEEIVVKSVGDDLILAGGSPRATYYAVVTFLEDDLGIRWWTPSASRIPWKPTLKVGPVDRRYAPPLEYREPFWYTAFDDMWSARNKANGIRSGGDDSRGGRHVYEGFVHTFYVLVPPEVYFKDHPEWFSEINGRRTTQDAQLCLTNEDMRRELVKNLKERLRKNPKATIASVSQNDCFNPCTCPKCRAVDEEEGSPSGLLLRFVNAVAADVKDEFPDVAIDTLAYQYTRKPPKITKPAPNVIVRLCSIECSFAKPLDDPANKTFYDDLRGWSGVADRLFIWDYTTNFSHYIQPHPNYAVLGPNVNVFVANKVRGIFEQGAYQSWGSEMAEMRAWMLAKLLWNPKLDPASLRHEFIQGYYGPAAKPVEEYLGLLERAVAASGDPLGCYSPADARFLSLDTLTRSWAVLNKAEAKAAGSLEYRRRIERVKMPTAYVVLTRWDSLRKDAEAGKKTWPWPAERKDLLSWFLNACKAQDITKISEWQSLEDWAAKGGSSR